MRTNIYAPFWILREAVPHLPPGSAIIGTTSEPAYDPDPWLYAYAQTKAATPVSLQGRFWITAARAQDKSNDTTARYFIIQASVSNLQEAAIGQLAAERAVNL